MQAGFTSWISSSPTPLSNGCVAVTKVILPVLVHESSELLAVVNGLRAGKPG